MSDVALLIAVFAKLAKEVLLYGLVPLALLFLGVWALFVIDGAKQRSRALHARLPERRTP